MALPANISTGRVEGQFIIGVADGSDLDDEPDFIPAQGTIDFTASTPYLPNPTATPNPVTMLKTTITGILDSQGYLCTPHALDATMPGKRGLRLIATDDPEASVKGWTWNVKPNLRGATGILLTGTVAAFSMYLPSGKTVDLTTLVKVPSSPGIGTEQAEALTAVASSAAVMSANAALEAQTFAELAIEIREQARAGAFDGEKGEKGDQGDQGDQGDRGETGLTPSITIGEVLTTPNPADGSWVASLIRGSAPVAEALATTFPSTMKGDKGDKGGLTTSAYLTPATKSFNELTTAGLYQWNQYDLTDGPPIQPYGLLQVWVSGTTPVRITQVFYPQTTAAQSRLFHQRTFVDGFGWYPWRTFSSQRVDNTAGKAVYAWDDSASREQLVYGDTGWRDVTGLSAAGWTVGKMQMRRVGYQVTINFDGLISASAVGHSVFMYPPDGFRPDTTSNIGNFRYGLATTLQGNSAKIISPEPNTYGIRILHAESGLTLHSQFQFFTRDPWPTSLPGGAIGIVPNL